MCKVIKLFKQERKGCEERERDKEWVKNVTGDSE